MKRIASFLLLTLVVLPCSSCIGGARGSVPVEAVLPTWEALAPYTRAGINESPDLTLEQRDNPTRELEVSLNLLKGAASINR